MAGLDHVPVGVTEVEAAGRRAPGAEGAPAGLGDGCAQALQPGRQGVEPGAGEGDAEVVQGVAGAVVGAGEDLGARGHGVRHQVEDGVVVEPDGGEGDLACGELGEAHGLGGERLLVEDGRGGRVGHPQHQVVEAGALSGGGRFGGPGHGAQSGTPGYAPQGDSPRCSDIRCRRGSS
ncbi:hypothetical protein SFR_5738 [Streptomyces sp. FR-008]|nr:hypothetical protein SFR_5738 [Streptomyces sp. FR-008]